MGARQFGPDLGQFLQADQSDSALADLGLACDPLTGNRYALAAGNPISYIEVDGHGPCPHVDDCGGKAPEVNRLAANAQRASAQRSATGGSTDPAPVVNVRPPDAGHEPSGAMLVTPSDVGGSRDPNVLENATMPGNPGWRALMPPRETGPGIQPYVDFFVPQSWEEAGLSLAGGLVGKLAGRAVTKLKRALDDAEPEPSAPVEPPSRPSGPDRADDIQPKPGSRGGPGTGSRYIPVGVKRAEIEAGRGICRFCRSPLEPEAGSPLSREFDHSIPYSQGGDATLENIQALCRTCNREKRDRTTEEYLEWLFLQGR